MISRDDLNPAQPREFQSRGAGNTVPARPLSPNARLALTIQPLTALLAAAFLAIAGWKEWAESTDVVLQRIAVGNALFFLVLRLTIGHFKTPRRHTHATTTIAVLAAISYPTTAIWLTNSAWPTNYIAIALAFA